MIDSVTCGVCGVSVDPGGDHVRVEATRVRIRDRDELDEFVLHERCYDLVVSGGWTHP